MLKMDMSHHDKASLTRQLQDYMEDELGQDLGQFEAEFLIDFIASKVGPFFYNQGLFDAQTVFQQHMESMSYAISDIEQATDMSE